MKLYAWPACARHADARSGDPHTFYGEHAIVDDPDGFIRSDTVGTYRWMRKGDVGRHYARHLIWRMVTNPIAHPRVVDLRNDLMSKASPSDRTGRLWDGTTQRVGTRSEVDTSEKDQVTTAATFATGAARA